MASDKGRLLPTRIKEVHQAEKTVDLQAWIKGAAARNDKISIAGMQHSQGGQTYYPGGVVLDMKKYNKVVDYEPEKKRITVQSGATWADIQKVINRDGLALRVMQSQNIFTVGGSLSVNAHGRDIRYGSLIDTVESFRLLTATGKILNVSRTEHPELFSLVIGGYGLFGVILDVTLKLTDDELYHIRSKAINYRDYTDYFLHEVKGDPNVRMHIARISVAPNAFLRDMYVTDYLLAKDQSRRPKYAKLTRERFVAVPKFFLGLSRYSDWGKNTLWQLQEKYFVHQDGDYQTRNNAMRSDSQFMDYDSPKRTEVLQEYFVPIDEFAAYIDDLRALLSKEDLNLLNITIRYVNRDEQAVMSYAKDDMFALVLLINQGRNKKATEKTTRTIRKMIDLTLDHHGSYYLPYYSYPTKQELEKAYPRTSEFFKKKQEYDPDERFVNLFYKEYGK
ncbi:FAD-dependent oxidoreductase [Camelliibacillus cellulosilyticus]|uniref:FAD-dependent oxidoreductase n=1 Tax=Camelliibacillus cellulosilyticus TaxID=2174486 RepID=A0ABV9GNC3_9BACL